MGYSVWGFGFKGLGRASALTLTSEVADLAVPLAMDLDEGKEEEG
jgi:hypothetical protein